MPQPSREVAALKFADVDLNTVPALADCDPGMRPTEYNCIIAPAVQPETKGSIILPDEVKDRMSLSLQVGRLVRISPVAFNYDKWPSGHKPPQPGEVVWFAKYAGGLVVGRDGREYRMIKDKDIGGVIETASEKEAA